LIKLRDLTLNKNRLKLIEQGALEPLTSLVSLDLGQNSIKGVFSEAPNSKKLDSLVLSFNFITSVENLDRCINLTVLDLHNNQLDVLSESILGLYQLKTLTISNNNLSDINPKIALIDSIQRMTIEGNPLRSIKPSMRNKGANEFKKFLKNRLEDEDIAKGEKKQAVALGIPGHSKMGEEEDPWANLFRDHLQGNSTLDLKGKDIKTWSPRLWIDYSHIKTLDLSNNPGLGAIVVPEEFGLMRSLQNLRLHQCGIDKLPVSLLKMEFL
jgi:Leucine-rich repeat (LRR) protein